MMECSRKVIVSYNVENGARMKAIVDIPSRHSLTEPDVWVVKHMFLQKVALESKIIHLLGLDVVRVDQVEIFTVVAASFYTCSSKTRLFTVYWRMVLAYDRG